MDRMDHFVGGEFSWFIGEIKDIDDPLLSNRVKVLPYGYYDDKIEKEKLPWSTVMMPTTSSSYKGTGSNHELMVGSWVVGFFRDGPSAQDAIILGSIASSTDQVLDIPVEAQLNPPTNKVHKTEAGHIIEIDNTPGAERINIKHKSTSFISMATDGTITIDSSNRTVNVIGNTSITGNLDVSGYTHSIGDVSTAAGAGLTLATHVHETTSMDTGSGSNSGKKNDSAAGKGQDGPVTSEPAA